jgi:hypothetical protein
MTALMTALMTVLITACPKRKAEGDLLASNGGRKA